MPARRAIFLWPTDCYTVADGLFLLAFARLSLYHVTLPAFVRKSVRRRRLLEQFFMPFHPGAS
jgi:hypothetical protein